MERRGNRMSMNYARSTRSRRRKTCSRILLLAAAIVLFAGLFVQISMLSRISSQSKQAAKLEREIVELSASAENLEVSINQYHNLETIAARAQQLGMEQPDETQIRVVNVARNHMEDTSIQTADASGGEKVIQ